MRALCFGLEGLLDSYRLSVLKAEDAILRDPTLPLTFLIPHLGDYPVILPYVYRALRAVEEQQLTGGALLNHLHERAMCGMPAVRDALLRYANKKLGVDCCFCPVFC